MYFFMVGQGGGAFVNKDAFVAIIAVYFLATMGLTDLMLHDQAV